MDTQTVGEVAEPTEEDVLREAYPAVTQFKGRTIRYAPLSEGQAVALQALDRDDDGKLAAGSFGVILAVLEGCVGPDQWQRIRLDLARKSIDAADVMKLFIKIVDKAKRDAGKDAAA